MKLRALLPCLLFAACPPANNTNDGGPQPAPIITSVSPDTGTVNGGTSITLNGTHFVSGATVQLAGVSALNVAFVSATRLTALTPPGAAPGVVSVTVTNPDGRAHTLANAFTYTPAQPAHVITQTQLLTGDLTAPAPVNLHVAASVLVPSVTEGTGQGTGVLAQVGFASGAAYTWSSASYREDSGDLDTYEGVIAFTTVGAFTVKARFSIDNGVSWTETSDSAAITITSASVDWCKLGGVSVEAPPTISLRGAAAGPTIYAQVYKAGVTDTGSPGAGLKGQLGYGTGADPSTWTWLDAAFNVDQGNNDEFSAALPNPGNGTYSFAFRFNADDGNWRYCDANGSDDGFSVDQAGQLTVSPPSIDSCVFQFPTALTTWEGRASGNAYGRVFVQGVTEASGAGAGIEGQLGYGPGTDPTNAAWVWSAAAVFNVDDGGGGDEYRQTFLGPAPGSYALAWRFRIDSGPWLYCDLDGSSNGLQGAQLPPLTANAFDVTDLALIGTTAHTALVNTPVGPYNARVVVPTLTDGAGQGAPLTFELAFGATGTQPSTWSGWTAASYSGDDADADLYTGALTAPSLAGAYDVAFRAKVGSHAYVYSNVGSLTVVDSLTTCRLGEVSNPAPASGAPLTVTAYVQSSTAAPQVQIGLGPQNDNASASANWAWATATHALDAGAERQFSLTTTAAYTGWHALSARLQLADAGWLYCDLNGSDVNGYEVAQQYDVNVGNQTALSFCKLQWPPQLDAGSAGLVYGQVYQAGLTENPGADGGAIIAQLGVGFDNLDPGFGWSWSSAGFHNWQSNNFEYQAALPASAQPGQHYAYRFSLDGGSWCYADFDPNSDGVAGSNNGFSGGTSLGYVTP